MAAVWAWPTSQGPSGPPAPGCPKCEPNEGLVLRRGSWRCTSAHEMVFMLAKTSAYFADGEAVREALQPVSIARTAPHRAPTGQGRNAAVRSSGPNAGANTLRLDQMAPAGGRNPRSVWTITTKPSSEPHYAMMPEELAERCIRSSPKKVCGECGAPWAPVVKRERYTPLEVGPRGARC